MITDQNTLRIRTNNSNLIYTKGINYWRLNILYNDGTWTLISNLPDRFIFSDMQYLTGGGK